MPDVLKLAVASCQHWEFGSYAAHRYIAQAQPDLVAFLSKTQSVLGINALPSTNKTTRCCLTQLDKSTHPC